MSKVIKKAAVVKTDEKQEILISELIELYKNVGFEVRVEKGSFKGGFCLLREQKLFLLNKNIEPIKKISFLAKNLSEIGIEDIFVKPELREIIEKESSK
jgi:hypothetical protein